MDRRPESAPVGIAVPGLQLGQRHRVPLVATFIERDTWIIGSDPSGWIAPASQVNFHADT